MQHKELGISQALYALIYNADFFKHILKKGDTAEIINFESKFMFTHRERTVKSTTVANAIASAKGVLKQKNITNYCSNAVSGRDPNEKITIEEASKLTELIVEDSSYHVDFLLSKRQNNLSDNHIWSDVHGRFR